jgi:hypothetical protein
MNNIAGLNSPIGTSRGAEYSLPERTVHNANTSPKRSPALSAAPRSSLISRAIDLHETACRRLEEVRLEIEQSRLDSPDNIRSSAQNMLNFGI